MKRLTPFAVLLFLSVPGMAQNASWQMPLLGKLDLPRVVNDTSIHDISARYSALWGYTDSATHKEYAILGCFTGTAIIDITAAPREIGWIPGLPSIWREMKTYSHYAYISTEARGTGQGIQIVDLQNPANPQLIATFDSTLTGAHSLSIDRHFLYCNGSNNSLRILDLTDPRHPRDVGVDTLDHLLYVHDCYVHNDTMYASHIYNNAGLGVYDMTDKQHPFLITRFTYPGAGTHSGWRTDDGKYFITDDEIGDTKRTCKVWELGDFSSVTQIAEFSFSDSEITHNTLIKGRYAFVAHYSAGVCVWDIANITIPVLVGYYDTYPEYVAGYNYSGAWGTYPFFESGKIITGDRLHGLFVNTLTPSPVGRVHVTLLDSESLVPIAIAPVRLSTPRTENLPVEGHGRTDYMGTLGLGVPDTGLATLRIARDTLSPAMSIPVRLIADSTIELTLLLGSQLTGVHQSSEPVAFQLRPAFPNPSRGIIGVPYSVRHDMLAHISVVAMNGARMQTSWQRLHAGEHTAHIDTHALAPGAYLCEVRAGGHTAVVPISVVR